ncbi:hypothetical protein CNBG_0426 [Cryptococcus deuterogattii R265]|uniref:uncharacterized protein n=1 Tax=Cryptococcus deuterogattii (strain R265) TaxID=294750 RepID=UPI001936F901|nr:hypothetical protein CNBG_0426 [Cryptococcus deuterogattii R265]
MDSTFQTLASIQANTLHPLPLRPINSEAKLPERSYRFITYGTEPFTEQENHAMAFVLDTEKESSGSRTNVGRSASGKKRSIAFAPNSPPSCHPTKNTALCTENEWSSLITRSATNHPASRLNLTTHQSSQSPVAPKAAFEEDELDTTSSSSSCSSELSEYEDNDDFESSDMSYQGREREREHSRAALVYGGMDCREIIEQDESGEDLPIKLHLKVPHLSSILGSSPIKAIDSENVTPSSSNDTPTNNTKRARTLHSTSTPCPMPLSSWDEERGNGVFKDCISDNGVECTDNTGGKVRQKEQRRNRERRREQNAMAQKKFRWKKKQMAEKVCELRLILPILDSLVEQQDTYGTICQMAADLESANATTLKLQKQLAERDSLLSDLQSELSLYKRKFDECILI